MAKKMPKKAPAKGSKGFPTPKKGAGSDKEKKERKDRTRGEEE